MSIHTATSVDFQTIEQPNHTETASLRTIFTRFRQPLTNIPWAFLGIRPAADIRDPKLASTQQPAGEAVEIDWPLFYECCDFSFYWVY